MHREHALGHMDPGTPNYEKHNTLDKAGNRVLGFNRPKIHPSRRDKKTGRVTKAEKSIFDGQDAFDMLSNATVSQDTLDKLLKKRKGK